MRVLALLLLLAGCQVVSEAQLLRWEQDRQDAKNERAVLLARSAALEKAGTRTGKQVESLAKRVEALPEEIGTAAAAQAASLASSKAGAVEESLGAEVAALRTQLSQLSERVRVDHADDRRAEAWIEKLVPSLLGPGFRAIRADLTKIREGLEEKIEAVDGDWRARVRALELEHEAAATKIEAVEEAGGAVTRDGVDDAVLAALQTEAAREVVGSTNWTVVLSISFPIGLVLLAVLVALRLGLFSKFLDARQERRAKETHPDEDLWAEAEAEEPIQP